jgi:diacylglycerol kinase family enzyme
MIYHLVQNPRARGARPAQIARALRERFAGIDWHECRDLSAGHLGLLDPGACRAREDDPGHTGLGGRGAIIVVGGDGTLSRVINAVGLSRLPVGIIPVGTANDLASHLGIPRDIDSACEVIRAGKRRAVDLISVNGKLFATCGGLGLPAAVSALANRWKAGRTPLRVLCRWLGPCAYVLAAGTAMGRQRSHLCLVCCEGVVRTADVFALVVSNQPRFGHHFAVSPEASNQDGIADLCAIDRPGGAGRSLAVLFAALRGLAGALPEAHSARGRSATIVTLEPTGFFGDGEILVEDRFFHIEVLPGALSVFAPDGPRVN